jgi:Protein of unknown function (DUF2723)
VRPRIFVAIIAGLLAFALYRATLLPGADFGDTGSFQATVGSPIITPRDGYPLYFALGDALLWATHAEPAHALNLASAIEGAIACSLIVLVAAELSGSVLAAAAAALLFAGSYTFWSQAIIAEVYALHALFVALTLLLLLRWERRPTLARLSLFFAAYALGFGNHLSMILLLPGFTLFLFLAAPRGWRSLVTPRVILAALAFAAAGALQYAWNLRALWISTQPPRGLADALQIFWFDVTKTDWRETMVLHVPASALRDHLSMYWFDLHQQFGWPGIALAIVGLAALTRQTWRRGVLLIALYIVNAVFAYSYNVGDAHVFYLPSHQILALAMAPGIVAIANVIASGRRVDSRARGAIVAAAASLAIAYAAVRIYVDYPELDRSADRRPTEVLRALTAGLDDRHAILLTDVNWQVQNGLSYYTGAVRPEVSAVGMPDVLQYAPALIRDNAAAGREVAVTERARAELTAAYGPLFRIDADARVHTESIAEAARSVPAGTRYVLCLLRPTTDAALDGTDVDAAARAVGADASFTWPEGDYTVIAGVIGRPPSLIVGSATPFRRSATIAGVSVDVRMESWLGADTIRRMGFAHVIAGRQHTLIVERGLSFAAFDDRGRPVRVAYAANIFAPQPRYVVRER